MSLLMWIIPQTQLDTLNLVFVRNLGKDFYLYYYSVLDLTMSAHCSPRVCIECCRKISARFEYLNSEYINLTSQSSAGPSLALS